MRECSVVRMGLRVNFCIMNMLDTLRSEVSARYKIPKGRGERYSLCFVVNG